ncbi:hypothetical protein NQZ68_002826 [Dissostichus eleginoides]|nr:hypothetical protein NQZ68_002826 [Dissostichus eleginoides]
MEDRKTKCEGGRGVEQGESICPFYQQKMMEELDFERLRPQTLRSGNISLFGLASRLHNDAPAASQTCRHRQRGLQHTGEK